MVNYIETEKKNIDYFPISKRYLRVIKPTEPVCEEYEYQKQMEYEKLIGKYNKTISLLESGYVNANNNLIETDDSYEFAAETLFYGIKENERIFCINPIQSNMVDMLFFSDDKITVSEFTVEKEIKTTDALLEQLVVTRTFDGIAGRLFTLGVNNKCTERVTEIFKKKIEIASNISRYGYDGILSLDSLIEENSEKLYLNNRLAHKYVKELIDLGYVILDYNKENIYLVSRLLKILKLEWFDLCIRAVKELNKEQIAIVRKDKEVADILLANKSNKYVRKIIKLLEMEENKISLVIETKNVCRYPDLIPELTEIKEFYNMGDLRTYLITEYHMPFDMASGDIKGILWKCKLFNIKQ